MYHLFTNKNNNYVYLTDYKQLFQIDDYSFKVLSNSTNTSEKERIIDDFKRTLKEVDYKSVNDVKNYRYGLFLNVANTCNAMCSYCFAGQGTYGKDICYMDEKTSKRSMDFFMSKVPEHGIANIIFFGGEPTLVFDLIVKTVLYVENKYKNRNYKFHIVTNGTLLTRDMIDFLAYHNFSMGLSIDGDKKTQNIQRPLRNKKDSYYEATKNLDYIFGKMKHVHARGTYSNFNVSLKEAYKHLLDLGFNEVSIPPNILDDVQNREFEQLLEQMDELYEFIVEYCSVNDDFPFGVFYEYIRRIFMSKLDINYSCGIGESIYSVDAYGNIYPCHRFVSEYQFILKNLFDEKPLKKFNYESQECHKCWNQYTCSHGCYYNDYFYSNSTSKNPYWCRYSKKMTELSLLLIAYLSESQLNRILSIS